MRVVHKKSTCLSFEADNLGRNVRKPFVCWSRILDRMDDDLSSEPFAHRSLAWQVDLTRRCLWHMMRLNETHHLSWCIADPVHVNNDFQLDYSAWCCSFQIWISNLLMFSLYFPFHFAETTAFLREPFWFCQRRRDLSIRGCRKIGDFEGFLVWARILLETLLSLSMLKSIGICWTDENLLLQLRKEKKVRIIY